ncbi:MAG: tyrosine-type recombinase/integrase [Treponema sp.]|nr:tyrosine-type recombinase/integrase [Treponema sp.]
MQFKNPQGKFMPGISTKKKTEEEATQVALQWLRDGVPQKTPAFHELAIKETVIKIKSNKEAVTILSELKRLGWLQSYIMKETPAAESFISYLKGFWEWGTSPYIKEKLRKKHGIHKLHCKKQSQSIDQYWKPFFGEKYLGEISAVDIDAFITHMGDMDKSAARKNIVIKAGTKALRWAFSKGMIEQDPTRGHLLFSGDETSRKILTPSVASAVFRTPWKNERAKLANMLASVTGMRSGEILALQFKDIGADCLYVSHSWNPIDKRKRTKNLEPRTVEIPFAGLIKGLFELVQQNPWGVNPDSYVFWSEKNDDAPMQNKAFVKWLRVALVKAGYTKDKAKEYDFHGWRHFFTAYMVKKLDKKLLKGETGHLTDEMLDHYANHQTIGDRERIQAAKLETFAGLLPEQQNVLEYIITA